MTINEDITFFLDRAIAEAHEGAPGEALCLVMRPGVDTALQKAGIALPLPVWYDDTIPETETADGQYSSEVFVCYLSDLEAMR